jgi:hypothetical protein
MGTRASLPPGKATAVVEALGYSRSRPSARKGFCEGLAKMSLPMGWSRVVYIGPGWLEVKRNGKKILSTFHFGAPSRSFRSSYILVPLLCNSKL